MCIILATIVISVRLILFILLIRKCKLYDIFHFFQPGKNSKEEQFIIVKNALVRINALAGVLKIN